MHHGLHGCRATVKPRSTPAHVQRLRLSLVWSPLLTNSWEPISRLNGLHCHCGRYSIGVLFSHFESDELCRSPSGVLRFCGFGESCSTALIFGLIFLFLYYICCTFRVFKILEVVLNWDIFLVRNTHATSWMTGWKSKIWSIAARRQVYAHFKSSKDLPFEFGELLLWPWSAMPLERSRSTAGLSSFQKSKKFKSPSAVSPSALKVKVKFKQARVNDRSNCNSVR